MKGDNTIRVIGDPEFVGTWFEIFYPLYKDLAVQAANNEVAIMSGIGISTDEREKKLADFKEALARYERKYGMASDC